MRIVGFLVVAAVGVGAQLPVPTENFAVAVLTPPANMGVACPQNVAADPTAMLDVPEANTYLSLCGMDLVEVRLGVTVIDGPGADLQVDEVNSNAAETYLVHVSSDGMAWVLAPGPFVNGAWAGDAAVDIAGLGVPTVNYVRITDTSGTVTGTTPGPDFDAVIAVNYLAPVFGAAPRPYPDTLVSYFQGSTTSALLVDGTQALGMPNAHRSEVYNGTAFVGTWHNFVSMGQGATLVLFFSQDYVVDGPGADLLVHEYYSAEGNQFAVEASDDGTHWVPLVLLGNATTTHGNGAVATDNIQAFDLAGTGLAVADFVRIVSTATVNTGATPGGEVDAVEAVNSVPKARRLTVGSPLVVGGSGTIELNVVASHVGDVAIVLPSGTPPTAAGMGLPLGPGVEFRLPFLDPVLQFVLTSPLAPAVVAGAVSVVPAGGMTGVAVTLPPDPTLQGVVLYWQAGLFPGGTVPSSGVSNIVVSTVQ